MLRSLLLGILLLAKYQHIKIFKINIIYRTTLELYLNILRIVKMTPSYTSALVMFSQGVFPSKYAPTVFEEVVFSLIPILLFYILSFSPIGSILLV